MKLLGLIGGTSWVSTVEYYTLINKGVSERLGGAHSARCVLVSLDFADIVRNVESGDIDANRELFVAAGNRLRDSGAEGVLLCAVTPHLFADDIARRCGLKVVHIADATAIAIAARGMRKVAVLGTRLTMEMEFFKPRLGAECLIPSDPDREFIHQTILGELGRNEFRDETRERYIGIISKLGDQGAEGVALACTEIPLLVPSASSPIPTFDTTMIHAQAAVEWMLS